MRIVRVQQSFAGFRAPHLQFRDRRELEAFDDQEVAGRKVPDRTGDKQHPIIKVSNLQDNFAMAWYAGGVKFPRPLPWTAAAPAVTPGLDAAQAAGATPPGHLGGGEDEELFLLTRSELLEFEPGFTLGLFP